MFYLEVTLAVARVLKDLLCSIGIVSGLRYVRIVGVENRCNRTDCLLRPGCDLSSRRLVIERMRDRLPDLDIVGRRSLCVQFEIELPCFAV